MPKIKSYTPGWLSRPSPGFQVFNAAPSPSASTQSVRHGSLPYQNGDANGDDHAGPNRTIARRGTEAFVVVENQIRWTDLTLLKDGFEEQLQTPSRKPKPTTDAIEKSREDQGPEDGSYRVLKAPIGQRIRQLSVSPNGSLLAIATSHTVHIAVLPDSSHLGQIPNSPIKLKTYTVGPTAHVLSQCQVTNIIWHPCGVEGNCLVTITSDAILRLWEFNRDNRWSFESPSLAIDLKKLVLGASEEDDFTPDKFGRNRRFSIDSVGLEVASACFGGTGSSHESGWSAMTLWIAMKGGDLYALCPLLPSKWQPSATLIDPISTAAVAREALQREEELPQLDLKQQWQNQLDWIRNVDSQNPTHVESERSPPTEVYSRPSHPGPIPRLQGPFQIFTEEAEEDLELTDIHVIAPRIDAEELIDSEDLDSEADSMDEQGVTVSIIALMTRRGRVFICIDLEGVEGQWLPRRKPKSPLPHPKDPSLVVLEGLDTLSATEQLDLQWPTFSEDIASRYSFFVTHTSGVFYLSCDPWIQDLQKELQDGEKLGAPLRIELFKDRPGTTRERILSFDVDRTSAAETSVAASLSFLDSDLGYFLLTSIDGHPESVTFDEPYALYEQHEPIPDDEKDIHMLKIDLLSLGPARTVYRPSDSFYVPSSLPRFLDKHVHSRHKRMMKEEVRLSTVTLDLMTQAHRVLSQETYSIGSAVSDLFRRCERLKEELSDQIRRVDEIAQRTDMVTGSDAGRYLENGKRKNSPTVKARIDKVRRNHGQLTSRYENLRKKFNIHGGKALSETEQLWVAEVDKTSKSLPSSLTEGEDNKELDSELWHRCREVKRLKEDLITRANEVSEDNGHMDDQENSVVPNEILELKIAQIQKLLGQQTKTVETAQIRLQRLDDAFVT